MEQENWNRLEKLAPFAVRAGLVETGRQRLLQHRNKLAFLLLAEDLSENSRKEFLRDFACPVYQALTMVELERLFPFHGTKVLGFRRGPLAVSIQRCLAGTMLHVENLREAAMPEAPRVVLFGAGSTGVRHARLWRDAGAQVVGFVEESPERLSLCGSRLKDVLGVEPEGSLDPEGLLEHLAPQIVDVCLPKSLHYQGCHLALRKGCHVLCKTPFLDEEGDPPKAVRKQRGALLSLAARRQRLFGIARNEEDVSLFAQGRATLPEASSPETREKE